MSKNKAEVEAINARIKEINRLLKHLVDYAISWLDGIEKKLAGLGEEALKRHTQITNINAVDVKSVTKRDISLKYDEKNGNLGTEVSGGTELFKVTPYDKILYVRKSGIYSVSETPIKKASQRFSLQFFTVILQLSSFTSSVVRFRPLS